MEKLYSLEEGIKSPRDGSVNWTHSDTFETLADAKKAAKTYKLPTRIVEMKVVWQSA